MCETDLRHLLLIPPSTISKKFQIIPSNQRVIYIKGLLGGGCCSSAWRDLDLPHQILIKCEEDQFGHSKCYAKLGYLYLNLGEFKKAERWFNECLKSQQKTLNPLHSDLSFTYGSLGEIHRIMRDFGKAEKFLIKSLGIQENLTLYIRVLLKLAIV
jgi:tetratricopeptide (TPR) repeat protein